LGYMATTSTLAKHDEGPDPANNAPTYRLDVPASKLGVIAKT
jgi:hypothetical protein